MSTRRSAGYDGAHTHAKSCDNNFLGKRSLVSVRGLVAQQTPEQYNNVIDSNETHEDIRKLSGKVKEVIQKNFQRHATSEKQLIQGIRRFGPSAQSKNILNRENEAAILAMKTGVYALWRCEEPKSLGASSDFCTRLGYKHYCFCGHFLEEHAAPKPARGHVAAPKCHMCGCRGFDYVPNEPEEIGEWWLTRRRDWDPSAWSAKCCCGHCHKQHDPRTRACAQCGCRLYRGKFLCVVCDRDGEAHTTVFEVEQERIKKGLPVREAFFPLMNVEWSLRELVLDEPSGGGALTAPLTTSLMAGTGGQFPGGVSRLALPPNCEDKPSQRCSSCAAVFRSSRGKFCSNCGKPRN